MGDYYLRQRYYDPESGRFLRQDTYEGKPSEPLTLHKYVYTHNSPVNAIDPTGLFSMADISAAHAIANQIMGQQMLFATRFAVDAGAKYSSQARDLKVIMDFSIELYHDVQALFQIWKVTSLFKSFGKVSTVLGAVWNPTKSKTSVQNAYTHWKKHRADYPHIQNSVQFVEYARNFIKTPPTGALVKFRANGEKVVYDPKTDMFAVGKGNGDPKTIYRPDPSKHGFATNLDYFNAQ